MALPDPYYSDDSVTLYHADCLDVLPHLSGVGLVLTSPPYNKTHGSGTEWDRLANGYGEHADNLAHDDYVRWQRAVLAACWDTLTDDGAIYYQHKPLVKGNSVKLPTDLAPPSLPLRQIVTWDRGSGFQRTFWHYVPRYEWVLIYAREAFRITSRDVFDLWEITPNADPLHPASFPLRLATKAIATTAAQVVLDPFAGSGTTLRAAKDLGRTAIGIEIEERYCEAAAQRLAQEVLPL